jgi:hypothetical protein
MRLVEKMRRDIFLQKNATKMQRGGGFLRRFMPKMQHRLLRAKTKKNP